MGIIVFFLLSPVLLPLIILGITVLFNADKWSGEKQEYQEYLEDNYDDYSNYENYYLQVADNAMAGDRDAMDELHSEFGDDF